jgi:hypothetical protein
LVDYRAHPEKPYLGDLAAELGIGLFVLSDAIAVGA